MERNAAAVGCLAVLLLLPGAYLAALRYTAW